jgi:hypothetical protein
LGKPNTQKAIDAFFSPRDKKQLDGLQKLLDATRRAQDANLTLETGQQLVPLAAGGGIATGLQVAPVETMLIAGSLSGFAKAYESNAFRNFLVKLANAKAGSKAEKGLLELGVTSVIAGQQAARAKSEETEETMQ